MKGCTIESWSIYLKVEVLTELNSILFYSILQPSTKAPITPVLTELLSDLTGKLCNQSSFHILVLLGRFVEKPGSQFCN